MQALQDSPDSRPTTPLHLEYPHPSQYSDDGLEPISSDEEEPRTATKTATKTVTRTLPDSATTVVTDSPDDEESKKRKWRGAEDNEKEARHLRDLLDDMSGVKQFKELCAAPDPCPEEQQETGRKVYPEGTDMGLVQTWEDVGEKIDDIIHVPCCDTAEGYNTRRNPCTIEVTNYMKDVIDKLWGNRAYRVIS